MATVELVVRGDQLGTFESFRGAGNNAGRRLVLRDVERIGDPDEFFTVIVEQVNPGTTQFQNGQFVTILDPDGDVVLPRTNVQPDAQQGRAAGDEHLVFLQAGIFIDLGGVPEEANRVVYREADETAGAEGDDDGELDFIDFPCFVAGTRIATPTGLRRVETLAPGDTLRTADGATVRVLWARGRCVDLTSIPGRHRPVEFKTGALGYRQLRLLRVSPDHRVRLSHPLAETLFGSRDVLVPAKALSRLPHCREM
ncbi:MAG: Hint domain-containing protein, partial [Pseudomonadota bacterium]